MGNLTDVLAAVITLQAFGFVLLKLATGHLPWEALGTSVAGMTPKAVERKETSARIASKTQPPAELCARVVDPGLRSSIQAVLSATRELEAEERPDYDALAEALAGSGRSTATDEATGSRELVSLEIECGGCDGGGNAAAVIGGSGLRRSPQKKSKSDCGGSTAKAKKGDARKKQASTTSSSSSSSLRAASPSSAMLKAAAPKPNRRAMARATMASLNVRNSSPAAARLASAKASEDARALRPTASRRASIGSSSTESSPLSSPGGRLRMTASRRASLQSKVRETPTPAASLCCVLVISLALLICGGDPSHRQWKR